METVAAEASAAVLYGGETLAADAAVVGIRQDNAQWASDRAAPDDLARDVYCVLGVPIDAIEVAESLRRLDAAAANGSPFLFSTVNLNFLISAAANAEFRDSLFLSDLCPADGMPIIWIARLLGLPIKSRAAGSDTFDALWAAQGRARPLRLFLFGGAKGVAAAAAKRLEQKPGGVHCVGWLYPGYGSIDELSRDEILDAINASAADMLVVALGALKGQVWLLRNNRRLNTPIRSHLGAVVNFAAGTVKRAPPVLRKLGLEWLWRIKEEPYLWPRYAHDGLVLLRLMLTRVLPLGLAAQWHKLWAHRSKELRIDNTHHDAALTLRLSGDATARYVSEAITHFRQALASQKHLIIDLSSIRRIDPRFFGLLLMVRKRLNSSHARLKFTGVAPWVTRSFRRHGVEFLLSE